MPGTSGLRITSKARREPSGLMRRNTLVCGHKCFVITWSDAAESRSTRCEPGTISCYHSQTMETHNLESAVVEFVRSFCRVSQWFSRAGNLRQITLGRAQVFCNHVARGQAQISCYHTCTRETHEPALAVEREIVLKKTILGIK